MDLKTLFNDAKRLGVEELEVYTQTEAGSNMSVFNHNIEDVKSHTTTVSYVRGSYNGHLGGIYVEDLNLSNEKIIEAIKENAGLITNKEPYFIYAGDETYPEVKATETDIDNYTLSQKQDLLKEIANLAEAYSDKIVAVPHLSYHEENNSVSIVNSNGLNVSKTMKYAVIICGVMAKEGDDVRNGYHFSIIKNFADFNKNELVKEACEVAIGKLNGTQIDSGIYKAVIKGSALADLLQAFSSMFSAESIIRKMTKLEGKEGEKLFGDNITIVDDPLCEFAPSQDAFDDEGVASYKKNIVEAGVFKTFLHNLKTAAMFNKKSTSNGYKANITSTVGIAPSKMYIAPGDKSLDELFALCGDGVYITDVTGLHAGINPVSGDFSLQSSGFMIENGVKTKPINLIVSSGNFIELLNDVIELGNDVKFELGNIAAPSVLLSKLSISGK